MYCNVFTVVIKVLILNSKLISLRANVSEYVNYLKESLVYLANN